MSRNKPGAPMTVEVYGCSSCAFAPGRLDWHRRCRLSTDDDPPVRHRNTRPGKSAPKWCPLRLGSVRHVLCAPNGKELTR